MALTRDFRMTVQARAAKDARFRAALLCEAAQALLEDDLEVGKTVLRDYIKATVGFERLGRETGLSPKSLIRMFGANGNPQARNLFAVLRYLQSQADIRLKVAAA
jgi:DNA-binding phage protein